MIPVDCPDCLIIGAFCATDSLVKLISSSQLYALSMATAPLSLLVTINCVASFNPIFQT